MEKAELENSFGQNVVDLAKRYTSEHSLDYFALFGCFCVSRYCSGGFYESKCGIDCYITSSFLEFTLYILDFQVD